MELRIQNLQISVVDVVDLYKIIINMDKKNIEKLCSDKSKKLLNEYFGNYDRPETIGNYDLELPLRVEAEYREFLEKLWSEIAPNDSRKIDEILEEQKLRMLMTDDDRGGLCNAYKNAKKQTLWERITKTNYKDVAIYKAYLKEYTEELLLCMRLDFLEEAIGNEIKGKAF